MKIIRFIGEDTLIYLGEDLSDGTARVIEGDLLGKMVKSDKIVPVDKLLFPIEPTNIYCIGLNYQKHAAETNAALPEYPVIFMKPTTTVISPLENIAIPACATRGPEVDYEGELAVVIGKEVRDVSSKDALDCVLGYTCANDVSARRWQKHAGGGQWIRGKSFDTFCPLGPALVTTDEIKNPNDLYLETLVNGETAQKSNTSDMIFSIAELISFLSQDTTLAPGTVILTGTPEGVGFVKKPPLFLKEGDTVSITIEKIGTLANPVISAR